jgi:hypothetical protein
MDINREIAALKKQISQGNKELKILIQSKNMDWDSVSKMEEQLYLMEKALAEKLRQRDLNNSKYLPK